MPMSYVICEYFFWISAVLQGICCDIKRSPHPKIIKDFAVHHAIKGIEFPLNSFNFINIALGVDLC